MAFRAAAVSALALTAVIAVPLANADAATGSVAPARAAAVPVRPLAVGAPAVVLRRLADGRQNTVITLLGDSTGNDKTEWFYQLSAWLAARYPAYRTTYRLWSDRNQEYGAATVLGAGAGSRTLTIYNGSVSGSKAGYTADWDRFEKLTAQGGDLVLLSYGHNEGSSARYASFQELTTRLGWLWPVPEIVPVLQNPEGPPTRSPQQVRAHVLRMRVIQAEAKANGWTTIDAYRPFSVDKRPLKTLVPDGVHPNAAGQALWLAAAKEVFLR